MSGYLDGAAGAAFLAAFLLIFTWSLVRTKSEQKRQELDAYERMVGGSWG